MSGWAVDRRIRRTGDGGGDRHGALGGGGGGEREGGRENESSGTGREKGRPRAGLRGAQYLVVFAASDGK